MQDDTTPQPIQTPTPPTPPVPTNENASQPDQPQLIGHDTNGNPLYGTPAPQPLQQAPQAQTVPLRTKDAPRMVNTSPSAVRPDMTHPKAKERHEESVKQYPELNLSEDEYIIAAVERHPIGMLIPLIGGVILACLILTGVFSYPILMQDFSSDNLPDPMVIAAIGLLLCLIVAGFVYMTVWVYRANRFIVTNESVVQEIQTSLFARREQTVSLGNVEDVSYSQKGVMQSIFNYGSIRLSTEGDETTYRMDYIRAPREQIALLTNAVEDFKNGRTVGGDDD